MIISSETMFWLGYWPATVVISFLNQIDNLSAYVQNPALMLHHA